MSSPKTFDVRGGPGSEDASRDLSQALVDWMQKHGPSPLFKSCGNCVSMRKEGPAFCQLYQQTPPVDVILAGCPSHNDEAEIPF